MADIRELRPGIRESSEPDPLEPESASHWQDMRRLCAVGFTLISTGRARTLKKLVDLAEQLVGTKTGA